MNRRAFLSSIIGAAVLGAEIALRPLKVVDRNQLLWDRFDEAYRAVTFVPNHDRLVSNEWRGLLMPVNFIQTKPSETHWLDIKGTWTDLSIEVLKGRDVAGRPLEYEQDRKQVPRLRERMDG
jgi:hypothetical protein